MGIYLKSCILRTLKCHSHIQDPELPFPAKSMITLTLLIQGRAAQFYFRPADYLPVYFGLSFLNLSYIYIRACNIIHMCSLYHSVHESTINNANLCKIG